MKRSRYVAPRIVVALQRAGTVMGVGRCSETGVVSPYPILIPATGLRFIDASKQSASKTEAYLRLIVMSAWPRICWRWTIEPPP
jgi:hypothetical protein